MRHSTGASIVPFLFVLSALESPFFLLRFVLNVGFFRFPVSMVSVRFPCGLVLLC